MKIQIIIHDGYEYPNLIKVIVTLIHLEHSQNFSNAFNYSGTANFILLNPNICTNFN